MRNNLSFRMRVSALLTTFAVFHLQLAPSLLMANPNGGSGSNVTIAGQGTNAVVITKSGARAVVNWNSFSIANGESTTFNQPNGSSAILNRVTGHIPSSLDSILNANGHVFLVNTNGVFVGSNGRISTGGDFVASTRNVTNAKQNFAELKNRTSHCRSHSRFLLVL